MPHRSPFTVTKVPYLYAPACNDGDNEDQQRDDHPSRCLLLVPETTVVGVSLPRALSPSHLVSSRPRYRQDATGIGFSPSEGGVWVGGGGGVYASCTGIERAGDVRCFLHRPITERNSDVQCLLHRPITERNSDVQCLLHRPIADRASHVQCLLHRPMTVYR